MKKAVPFLALIMIIAFSTSSQAVKKKHYTIEEKDLEHVVVDDNGKGEDIIDDEIVEEEAVVTPGENVEEVDVDIKIDKKISIAPAYVRLPREKTFRVGIVGPGIYAGNKNIDAMMSIGAEGEYFIFERLSAGLKIQVATDFQSNNKPNSVTSFIPQARYIFDFINHPRWSAYVQAGVGVALIDGDNIAVDIAIPGGGFWWQYNERFSIGGEASLHILARSNTAVAFQAGPVFRYQF